MKTVLWLGFSFLLLQACSGDEKSMEERAGIRFMRYNDSCTSDKKAYWLVGLKVRNAADSLFINTEKLGRKVELHTDQMNMNSDFFKLAGTICTGDSMYMALSADLFYTAMNSKRPDFLKAGEEIRIDINIYDRLNPQDYSAYKEAFEKERMKKYIEKSGWNAEYDSSSGIYYEKLISKDAMDVRDTVLKLKYVIKTTQDQLIAFSKDKDPLLYHKKDSNLLQGIHVLVTLMNRGERLRAIIPSPMAFGKDGKGNIPGYSPIVLELEYQE